MGHPKSTRGCRDSRNPVSRYMVPGPGAISVQRTRSHRRKFCVEEGLGGVALDKQTAGNVECVLTLALLASRVCGYPHALLACI